MKKIVLSALLLTALTSAAPLVAGTVFVPYAAEVEVGGVFYTTRVWATNTADDGLRRVQFRLIQSGEDGTLEPQGAPLTVAIDPGETRVILIANGVGLLQLTGADEIAVSARLVPFTANGPLEENGIQLPIVSDRSLRDANQVIDLQGWFKDGDDTVANLGIVNLGSTGAQCTIEVLFRDGTHVMDPAVIAMAPLSHRQFDDALGLLDQQALADARGTVSCDQPFYAYASIFNEVNGNVVFVTPSATLGAGRSTPGPGPAPPTGDFVYLSDMNWSNTNNIRNGPHRDRSGWDPHAGTRGVGGYKKIGINGVEYDKGVSFFPFWGRSFIEWNLNGEFTRFTALARIDDEKTGEYEWARVDRATDRFIRLERPSNGFRAPEGNFLIRISGGGTMQIFGDGQLLFNSGEIYAYGPPAEVDIDVTGVQTLRVLWDATHHEQAGAPHRNQLPNPPVRVIDCGWHDLLDLADAKLFK